MINYSVLLIMNMVEVSGIASVSVTLVLMKIIQEYAQIMELDSDSNRRRRW